MRNPDKYQDQVELRKTQNPQQRQQSQTTSSRDTAAAVSRAEWLKRSIVRRTIRFVENDLEHVIAQSPFLAANSANNPQNDTSAVAVFQRSEIKTGELQGKGGFSVVYEITGFDFCPNVDRQLSPEQREARELLQQSCIDPSTGKGRYAIKFLQEKLLPFRSKTKIPLRVDAAKDFSFAASDLAVETKFLTALNHDNILSIRGTPLDGIHALRDGRHDGYFIITDRLVDTLDQRIKTWNQRKKMAELEEQAEEEQQFLLCEKMEYALQLAKALEYLHDRRIVFRDLKPQNIGFSASGHLQLFDFGLCREVPASATAAPDSHLTDLYEMSGVGTRRYMAVEIVNTHRYNVKADVYGWSMVVWELLIGSKPFPLYSVEDHRIMVCQGGERPPLPSTTITSNSNGNTMWPEAVRTLLKQSWTESVRDRLTIYEVCDSLRSILFTMTTELQQQQQQEQRRILPNLSIEEPTPVREIRALHKEESPQSPTGVMDDIFTTLPQWFIPEYEEEIGTKGQDSSEGPVAIKVDVQGTTLLPEYELIPLECLLPEVEDIM